MWYCKLPTIGYTFEMMECNEIYSVVCIILCVWDLDFSLDISPLWILDILPPLEHLEFSAPLQVKILRLPCVRNDTVLAWSSAQLTSYLSPSFHPPPPLPQTWQSTHHVRALIPCGLGAFFLFTFLSSGVWFPMDTDIHVVAMVPHWHVIRSMIKSWATSITSDTTA